MSYTKVWADNEKLSKEEKLKLEKDGLEILNDIPQYAKDGFESIPKDQWNLFKWAGLYLQKPKEDGYFMMRVNVPSGILTNEQTVALAEIAKDYGRSVVDITTRQAIQFHWLTIEQIPDIFSRLEKVGLSSVGACGDIMRTIVGNPLAGIDPNETVDTRNIVEDVYWSFQKNEQFSNLPRKFKISISGNVQNAQNAEINCLSFVPATKVIDGVEVNGFHVYVGGGLSSKPYLAEEVDVFVRPEQVKEVTTAITTIYRDFGYREKRHRARLKFLIADWGTEKFKEKLLEYVSLLDKGENKLGNWNAGYFYGVHQQKQNGLSYIGFNVPVGRMDANELLELARISKHYGNGELRTCNSQNIVIPNVKDEDVESLLQESIFNRITLNPPKFIGYSVSCTGIEYCNLALVETKERMRDIANYLDEKVSLDVPVRIHMVGCPNSCGQRQIADIGLQGILMKNKEKKMVEAFEIYVGGTLTTNAQFNEKLKGKILAEDLNEVLRQFVTYFADEKLLGETFHDFYKRIGVESLQEKLNTILNSESFVNS
ncbi:nitrite/sulfite reductase [Evansella cellulosilytica]|uniref:Ferredoxin--nitrite reductase n=1 Tax=Evansella cellulosilytica (strain ATCC 21833 / DSM 2522 / FERM P-1141 / JCM 9156 / N-4) TaxID=649639 RepID=E6U1U6_EVAC2|nr:ferredoxin--nitrite reductase [Evansella cellulosilytica]ADU31593.1 Ferredoxin--nitrite reductase [Evansella cellulosilytica DSM 2522]